MFKKSTLILFSFFLLFKLSAQNQPRLNEIMAGQNNVYSDLYGDTGDWIELYNPTSEDIDLAGYFLSDDLDSLTKFQFPNDERVSTIPASGYLIIWVDNDIDKYGLHASFKLDQDGEQVVFSDPQGEVLDMKIFESMKSNESLYRIIGSDYWAVAQVPTPNLPNLPVSEGLVSFSKNGGIFSGLIEVEIAGNSDDEIIRYTLDGSNPDEKSERYVELIQINENTILKARLFKEGYNPGLVETQLYLIDVTHDLPIVSISTNPQNLWDDYTGIYVAGKNGESGNCRSDSLNWNRDWEHKSHIQYFEANGDIGFEDEIGIEISGQCSRQFPQKSLKLKWRARFGTDSLYYQVFSDKVINIFTDLLLRNSGSEFEETMFHDALVHQLIKDRMKLDHQAYEPVVVYINGQYWGLQNLRERINAHYLSSNRNIDSENINLIENYYTPQFGKNDEFLELKTYIETNDLSNSLNYQYVSQLIDIEHYINYYITQLYLGNYDWPQSNIRYWNKSDEISWNWILADTDASMTLGGFEAFDFVSRMLGMDYDYVKYQNPTKLEDKHVIIFKSLWSNQAFRNDFSAKYLTHMNTTFHPSRMVQYIDSLADKISLEISDHKERWGQAASEWYEHVNDLKQFAEVRFNYELDNFQNVMDSETRLQVTLDLDELDHGWIEVNGISVNDDNPSFTGTYLSDIVLKISARRKNGFVFSHWSGDIASYEKNLNLVLNQNLHIEAHYIPNTAPTITSANFSIEEHSPYGTLIGYVDALDTEDILTYSILNGNDHNAFSLDSITGILTVSDSEALNYEIQSAYTLEIKVSDGSLSTIGIFNIYLRDIDETAILNIQINENSIYPNPAQHIINIKYAGLKEVWIYSVLGEKVLSSKEQKIDISQLKKGIYIVKIEGPLLESVTTKFIKE